MVKLKAQEWTNYKMEIGIGIFFILIQLALGCSIWIIGEKLNSIWDKLESIENELWNRLPKEKVDSNENQN